MMDLMIVSFYVLWFFKLHTYRICLSYTLFYGIRAFVQNHFLMGVPEGFLWADNGFPSLVIVYMGVADFFYSGHVGSVVLALSEYHAQGYRKMTFVIGAVLVN